MSAAVESALTFFSADARCISTVFELIDKNLGDGPIGATFCDELDNGSLSRRQCPLASARSLRQEVLEQRLRDFTREEGLVSSQRFYCRYQKPARVGLEQKSASASFQHVPDKGVRVVHREDQNLDTGHSGADLPSGFHSVHGR